MDASPCSHDPCVQDFITPARPPVAQAVTPKKLPSAFTRSNITTPIGNGGCSHMSSGVSRSHSAKRSLSIELDKALLSPPSATSALRHMPRYRFSLANGYAVSPERVPWRRGDTPASQHSTENLDINSSDLQAMESPRGLALWDMERAVSMSSPPAYMAPMASPMAAATPADFSAYKRVRRARDATPPLPTTTKHLTSGAQGCPQQSSGEPVAGHSTGPQRRQRLSRMLR